VLINKADIMNGDVIPSKSKDLHLHVTCFAKQHERSCVLGEGLSSP